MVPRRGTGVSESGTGAGRRAENNVVSLASKRSESSSMLAEGEALETLRAALDDLRREIRTQLPRPGADAEAQAKVPGRVDWFALFDELRVRLGHLGMRESSGEIDEFGMDFDLVERMRPLLDFLAEKYWRIDLRGDEHIPDAGPALYVANRSGLLPYDGWMLAHLVEKIGGGDPRPHFMVDDDLMALPFLQPVLARAGGVLACPENAERLLASGHSVVIFPEGMRGAIKTFDQRYELQGFGHHSLLGAAFEAGVPIVPVGVVGAEETQPMLFRLYLVAWMMGLPFLPVTPTFPLLGPLGLLPLPSRWGVEFGQAVGPEFLAAEGGPERVMGHLRDRVRVLVDRGRALRPSPWT